MGKPTRFGIGNYCMANYYNISLEEHMANCSAPIALKAAESSYGIAMGHAYIASDHLGIILADGETQILGAKELHTLMENLELWNSNR